MSSSTEVENVNTKTSSNENNTQLTQAVVSESTTPDGSHSDGSTAQHGTAEHKFYVPPSALVFYGMAFFGLLCSFALRAGLSVAIVAMVNQTAVSDNIVMTNNSDNDQCPRDPVLQSRSGEFIWNRHEQGAVLAAYYYGQQVTMVWRQISVNINKGDKFHAIFTGTLALGPSGENRLWHSGRDHLTPGCHAHCFGISLKVPPAPLLCLPVLSYTALPQCLLLHCSDIKNDLL